MRVTRKTLGKEKMTSMVHGKTVVRSILLLPFLMLPASADMGSFPLVSGEIHEEEQSAIIVLDTARHRETIILQTNVRSNREVTGVFFMPLPAKPAARLAPEGMPLSEFWAWLARRG